MYKISTTNKFEKDLVKCLKKNFDIAELETIVKILEKDGILPKEYKPHKLLGEF
jgi:mRNA interferase YafQ